MYPSSPPYLQWNTLDLRTVYCFGALPYMIGGRIGSGRWGKGGVLVRGLKSDDGHCNFVFAVTISDNTTRLGRYARQIRFTRYRAQP